MAKNKRKGPTRPCKFCGCELYGSNYPFYLIREATKPPRTPRRWQSTGEWACEDCGDKNENPTSIDPWR